MRPSVPPHAFPPSYHPPFMTPSSLLTPSSNNLLPSRDKTWFDRSLFEFYQQYWVDFGQVLTDMEARGILVDRKHLAGAQVGVGGVFERGEGGPEGGGAVGEGRGGRGGGRKGKGGRGE
jgi:hypothetical protein